MLYIKFHIKDQQKFEDFKKIYEVLEEIKPREESKPLSFWKTMFPEYAINVLGNYCNETPLSSESFEGFINYLEFGFEADFKELSKPLVETAIITYKPLAFPYGGMERLLVFLKMFDCIPTECYNGFTVYTFKWLSDFDHDAIELPEKTKAYLKSLQTSH